MKFPNTFLVKLQQSSVLKIMFFFENLQEIILKFLNREVE